MLKNILFCLAIFALVGCTLDDNTKDRCIDGMEWNDDYKSCVEEGESSTCPGEFDDTDNYEIAGLGDDCTSDTDDTDAKCDQDADQCIINPLTNEEPGYCTVGTCTTSDDCPGLYLCCDCTSLDWIQACFQPCDAAQVSNFGCECS